MSGSRKASRQLTVKNQRIVFSAATDPEGIWRRVRKNFIATPTHVLDSKSCLDQIMLHVHCAKEPSEVFTSSNVTISQGGVR